MRDLLHGFIDSDRVAFVGHSFGGATALLASEVDHRPKCSAVWDPWVQKQGPVPEQDLARGLARCPQLLTICSDWESGEVMNELREMSDSGRLHEKSQVHVLPATGHQNYSDFALLAPVVLRKVGMIGTAEPRDTLEEIVGQTLDFIDLHSRAL